MARQVDKTYWNGEPTTAVAGTGIVNGVKQRVVRVFYGAQQFDLDDTDGSGWAKVTTGEGSPKFRHKNVTLKSWSFEPDSWVPMIREYLARQGIDPDKE